MKLKELLNKGYDYLVEDSG